ncbi:cell surface protein [Chitinophaga sp. Mgbs1]|uniref:Cell surface protein n=1 Tax=Chitinophaga solisilvae TaxID=1233460 RepID=A0A9Q5D679_9BACT|nr:cell surface protein [Chitinophaga solisilvae]
MKIPRIFHQTWKNNDLPDDFRLFMNTWKKHHPSWEHVLWTDEMNRLFIREKYPGFLPVYDSYETNIQRVDAVRYFIINSFGGVYVDLDMECVQPLEPLLAAHTCVLGQEPAAHCQLHNKQMIISNAFIAAAPAHPFIRKVCTEMFTGIAAPDDQNDYILESTGPFRITTIYEQMEAAGRPTLASFDQLYPLTKDELQSCPNRKHLLKKYASQLNTAYAIHYYWGTWWKGDRKLPLLERIWKHISSPHRTTDC